jgi:membrane associated rhomboid family serine protease
MLEDRYYMRRTPFETRRSATMMLLIANVVVFIIECLLYGYPPGAWIPQHDYLALSWWGLAHGYIWQLVTFQFLHGGFMHLLGNCWVIYVFGRDLEEALGVKRFLTLYFSSGVIGGLLQAVAGGLALHFGNSSWARSFAGPTLGASAGALGLLAAFATLYPERPLMLLLFFVIPVGMRAKFLLLISGLLAAFGILFPYQHLADVAHLGGILTGVFFVRYAIHWEWRWPQFRRTGNPSPRRLVKISSGKSGFWGRGKSGADEGLPPEEFLSKEVDPILDKISAQGIQSLTERERRILQAARDRMGKR